MGWNRSEKFVALNELICELAYGRKMNFAEMVAYERDNNCAPAKSKKYDPLEELGLRDLSGGVNIYACGVNYIDPDYDECDPRDLLNIARREEALRSPAYCEARDFIFELAEAGEICIYARRPKRESSR